LKIGDYKVLTDENIHADVVQFPRAQGFDVLDVREDSLHGTPDRDLLSRAIGEDRLVFTHDSDFGTLAILAGLRIVGIVYLRPGHIDPTFTIETINTLVRAELDLVPPFILVAQRKADKVAIRLRTL